MQPWPAADLGFAVFADLLMSFPRLCCEQILPSLLVLTVLTMLMLMVSGRLAEHNCCGSECWHTTSAPSQRWVQPATSTRRPPPMSWWRQNDWFWRPPLQNRSPPHYSGERSALLLRLGMHSVSLSFLAPADLANARWNFCWFLKTGLYCMQLALIYVQPEPKAKLASFNHPICQYFDLLILDPDNFCI